MPYLGAGVDQQISPLPVPTWIFTPTPGVAGPSVRVYNQGSSVVFVGGANVSPFNGLPIYPGNKPTEFANMPQTLWTCANAVPAGGSSTLSAAAVAAGSTTFTTAAAPNAGLSAGATFILGTAPAQEVLTVASTSASSVITTTTKSLYDHAASSPLSVATVYVSPIRVTAGVL